MKNNNKQRMNRSLPLRRSALALGVIAALSDSGAILAQGVITIDGSLPGTTAGGITAVNNVFTIPQSRGYTTPNGANLFHSFGMFTLPQSNQTASFTGASNVQNIISRVTGIGTPTGLQATVLNGTIESAIPGANFWFVNPAGVVINSTGRFDVSGTLAVGAADAIRFQNGDSWYALGAPQGGSSVLSVSTPTAFGFLPASTAGTLALNSVGLVEVDNLISAYDPMGDVGDIVLAGGNVTITNSDVETFGFVQSGVPVHAGDVLITADRTLTLSGRSQVATGNESFIFGQPPAAAGNVFLRAGTIVLSGGAQVRADTRAVAEDADGNPIATEVNLSATNVSINGARINGNYDGTGFNLSSLNDASNPALSIETTGGAITVTSARIASINQSGQSGAANDIELTATGGLVDLIDTEITTASSATDEDATIGNIRLAGNTVRLRNGTRLTTGTTSSASAGGISLTGDAGVELTQATIDASSDGDGFAGDISLVGGGVLIAGGSFITADYNQGGGSPGGPGSIEIRATGTSTQTNPQGVRTLAPGVVAIVDSGVTSDNIGGDDTGDDDDPVPRPRGDIGVFADDVVIAGSIVTTEVSAAGVGDDITIDGQRGVWIVRSTGVGFAPPGVPPGDPRLVLEDPRGTDRTRSLISARTNDSAAAAGGLVRIEGGNLGITIEDSNVDVTTTLGRNGQSNGAQNRPRPNLEVDTTGRLELERASIRAATGGTDPAGDINLRGSTVEIIGGALTATSTGERNAGNIRVTATAVDASSTTPALTIRGGAKLSSDSNGAASATRNAGTINLEANQGTVGVYGTRISCFGCAEEAAATRLSTTATNGGNAGTISVNAAQIDMQGAYLATGAQFPQASVELAPAHLEITATGLARIVESDILATSYGRAEAGRVQIQGSNVELSDTLVSVVTDGSGPAGRIRVVATGADAASAALELKGVFFTSSADRGTAPTARAGGISVEAAAGTINVTQLVRSNGAVWRPYFESRSGLAAGSAGAIDFTGQNVRLSDAILTTTVSSALTDLAPSNISVTANGGVARLSNSDLSASTFGGSNAGNISVGGSFVDISAGSLSAVTENRVNAAGDAGSITITAQASDVSGQPALRLRDGAGVSSSAGLVTLPTADAGSITVAAPNGTVQILGAGLGVSAGPSAGRAGGIAVSGRSIDVSDGRLLASSAGTGSAGSISLAATGAASPGPALRIRNGSLLSSTSQSAARANAGSITLTADQGAIEITGTAATPTTLSTSAGTTAGSAGPIRITAPSGVVLSDAALMTTVQAQALPALVERGDIAIDAQSGAIRMTNALLDARTTGVVRAGDVTVQGDAIEIRGGRQPSPLAGGLTLPANTAIVTSTSSGSAAGGIVLQASAVLVEDAFVSSQTSSSGNAGTICIEVGSTQCVSNQVVGAQAGPFAVLAAELPDPGGITLEDSTVASSTSGGGAAGQVALYGTDIVLRGGLIPGGLSPSIVTSSTGAGQGGNVTITLAPNGSLLLDETVIATSSLSTNGGNIQVNAQGGQVVLTDSVILASAGANGRGGNVVIDRHGPTALHRSQIFATAVDNNGGNITLRREGDAVFVSDSQSIVNADSGFGVDGVIDIDSPDTDISAAIQSQDIAVTEPPALAATACEPTQGERSRFVVEGRGGVQIGVDEYQTASLPGGAQAAASSSPSMPVPPPTATLAAVSAEEGCR